MSHKRFATLSRGPMTRAVIMRHAASWTPASVAGLLHWSKADGQGFANNQSVATLSDLSGKGNHLTQATIGMRPTFVTDTGNGKPGLSFASASTQHLVTAATLSVTSFAVFCVMRQAADTLGVVYELGDESLPINAAELFTRSGSTISVARTPVATVLRSDNIQPVSAWAVSTPYLRTRQQYAGTHASHRLFINATEITYGVPTNTDDPGVVSYTKQFVLAARAANGDVSPGLPFNGYIGETLVYSPMPSAADIALIESYLTARW